MPKENRKNIPEEKKEQRNRYDTSADNIVKGEAEGRHFNENVRPRHPGLNPEIESDPDAYLGAEEVDDDESMSSVSSHSTTGITAPEVRQDITEEEEETLEEIKRDMTGG